MRVTTAFNRILDLPGASVVSVAFTDDGVVVGVRRRAKKHRCPCGAVNRARYDTSRRRWRHLDLVATKLWIEADIARVDCGWCGRVRTEVVPWARPRARHTRDFEDTVAYLAQRTDKTSISQLMRCSWAAVDRIVQSVVADHIDDTRLDGLVNIGVDEISYKRGHVYLTVIACHDTGRVVDVQEGASSASLSRFFEELGTRRCRQIEAISMDMATRWQGPTSTHIPQAAVCYDAFHIIKWCNEALDVVYRTHSRDHGSADRQWRTTRTALRTGEENLDDEKRLIINRLRRNSYRLWRAWELKERLRALFKLTDPELARRRLEAWCRAASRSRMPSYVNLSRRIRRHFDGIINTIRHQISNSRIEGINSKIRLVNRRAHGHRSAKSLIAMIFLNLGGVYVELPTQR